MPPKTSDSILRFLIALTIIGLSVAAAFGWIWGFGF